MYTVSLLYCYLTSNIPWISAGSKEESFFDSQAWFESDCEDDFFSVNGGKKPLQHEHSILCKWFSGDSLTPPLSLLEGKGRAAKRSFCVSKLFPFVFLYLGLLFKGYLLFLLTQKQSHYFPARILKIGLVIC